MDTCGWQTKEVVSVGPTVLHTCFCSYPLRSNSPDMKTVFHARPDGRFLEIKRSLDKKKTTEQIKAPIVLEPALTIKPMSEPQSNLEEKENPIILTRG